MDCKTCENILLDGITPEAKEHIKTCENCQLYFSLLEQKTITIKHDYLDPYAINKILIQADKEKKKNDLLSLFAFIICAIVILSIVIYFIIDYRLEALKYYLGLLSGFMPFTLPILFRLKRKAVL